MVEAVVEFDYEAQQDDELSLNVGDVIVNIRRDDGGWWEGELGGRRGLFPDNFVREIKKEGKRDGGQAGAAVKADLSNGRASPVSEPGAAGAAKKGEQIRKRRCKAAFSYVPQHEDELELKIGDIIEILAEVEEGWWEGVLNGKSGMFPSNFTKEILLEADGPSADTPASQEEHRGGRNSKNSPVSESDGGDCRADAGSGEIQPKKVKGFGFGDIFKDQPIRLRPCSADGDSDGDKVAEWKTAAAANPAAPDNMKSDPDGRGKGRELCKVLFPYEAQNEDELTIKEGEIIAIITKECADTGWWMGEVGGRQGVFPDNFVKLLEAEKERPKKPPPPSALATKHAAPEKKSDVKKVPPERPEHLPHRDQDRGDEVVKPSLPTVLPKKPFPPKTPPPSSASQQPPRRPERPPALACESPKSDGGASTPESGPDRSHATDLDLDAVVPSAEKLSHPTASRPRVTDRRPRSQIITASSVTIGDAECPAPERAKEDPEPVQSRPAEVSARKGLSVVSPPESKSQSAAKSPSSLNLPGGPGHRPASPSSPSASASPSPELRQSPSAAAAPTLEELRRQLRELRGAVELLKSQHRQEMKQLAGTLDEEKKIRLSLQMEVEHIKKILSK
ncbi:SH3 domain-containing kinase-binding protein 1 isoform X2 [Syngnathoides biaculeatus]|uniref:SH3 domain-containing kinase-binding protein 1 isoform X2 n=1 Tax=Syngnathoides biaculeatus TaxID=300417 RepID=UPI002ADD5547|nr:SH3 domain-containing kinase-binding protein 1 isoform X2 [Syngnathoides biaculeatus]